MLFNLLLVFSVLVMVKTYLLEISLRFKESVKRYLFFYSNQLAKVLYILKVGNTVSA